MIKLVVDNTRKAPSAKSKKPPAPRKKPPFVLEAQHRLDSAVIRGASEEELNQLRIQLYEAERIAAEKIL